jgi:hypothetical protein
MIALCLGRRELGKTTLALYLASRKRKSIILDPRSLIPTTDPIGDLPGDESEFLARLDDPDVRQIVVQPQDRLDETTHRLASLVRQWSVTSGDGETLAVVLDEAALLDLRGWDWVFRCSPRQRLLVILTAHRPQDIPTTIRALADSWCIFRTTQRHDLDAIEERCGERVRAEVQRLKPREFVLWDDARSEMRIYRDPTLWFVPVGSVGSGDADRLNLPAATAERKHPLLDD